MKKNDKNIQTYLGFSEYSQSKIMYDLSSVGYSVVKNVLSSEEVRITVQYLKKLMDDDIAIYGDSFLRNKGELGQIRAPICRDAWFDIFAHSNFVDEILKSCLYDTSILHLMNGIITSPGFEHNQASFHRDFPKPFVANRPLSINIFYALTEFNKATGGTWLVPGSHKLVDFPSKSIIEKNKIQLTCGPGDVLVFDSMLIHASGINTSEDDRYSLNTQFTLPFVKQQLNMPEFLKICDRQPPDSLVFQRMGGWTIPPKSVDEFRYGVSGERTYRSNQG